MGNFLELLWWIKALHITFYNIIMKKKIAYLSDLYVPLCICTSIWHEPCGSSWATSEQAWLHWYMSRVLEMPDWWTHQDSNTQPEQDLDPWSLVPQAATTPRLYVSQQKVTSYGAIWLIYSLQHILWAHCRFGSVKFGGGGCELGCCLKVWPRVCPMKWETLSCPYTFTCEHV